MERTFKSKVDAFIVVIVIGAMAFAVYTSFVQRQEMEQSIFLHNAIAVGVMALVVLPLVFNTRYVVSKEKKDVSIKCGLIPYGTYNIEEIVSVEDSHTIWASPAVSLDRIKLNLKGGKSVVISPKEKMEFVNLLQSINSGITYRK